jgi:hypothetical protein
MTMREDYANIALFCENMKTSHQLGTGNIAYPRTHPLSKTRALIRRSRLILMRVNLTNVLDEGLRIR